MTSTPEPDSSADPQDLQDLDAVADDHEQRMTGYATDADPSAGEDAQDEGAPADRDDAAG